MQTGDGLLARLRIRDNRLSPRQLADICQLALKHGNGAVEITARGNLQVRGLTEASTVPFAEAVKATVSLAEGIVNNLSPLAGDDPEALADPRPLADAIAEGAMPFMDRLGPKVSIVIDCSGQWRLGELKADIRLVAQSSAQWLVTLGGGAPQVMDRASAVGAALAVLSALAALGPEARATDLFPARNAPSMRSEHPTAGGPLALRTSHTLPIALPFGQMDGRILAELCDLAMRSSIETLRLAPGHMLLIDGAGADLIAQAADLGFITTPDDPRRQVSACIGSLGCRSGHIAAREIGTRLAPHLQTGQHLHVSGCEKGCAHPRRAEVTLVGRADGIGLVIDGRAGDTPERVLDEAGLVPALAIRQEG